MSNVTFTIQAPELSAAIIALAAAMSGTSTPPAPPVSPAQPQPQPLPPTAMPPVAPPPPPPPVVPTAAAPTYSREQIMTAGAALADAGKMGELIGLLNAFGVQAVTQLKQEQLGAFATELRKLGAQI